MKKRQEEAKKGAPAWMATYGDMVTLLLCFFVLLFSMSSVDIRKFKEAIASFNDQIDIMPGGEALVDADLITNGVNQLSDIQIIVENSLSQGSEGTTESDEELSDEQKKAVALDEAREVYERVNAYLTDQGIREEVDVSYALNFVKITIPGEALFDSGQAIIKPEALSVISILGEMIKGQSYEAYNIQIEGHTDNVPIRTAFFPSNWELSASRAIAVGKYLIDNMGFSEEKIACTGYGEYRPIVSNDSNANRAKNRRVEMKIVLQSEEVQVEEYNTINAE
ncbi:Chemotaxis protein [Petrocella atlantisensis]|uniref:Chemotaxis protein n=1 Tax=Petrocella atlantisensis TaxID=2173034 RepID=A0A3P7NSZ1_9FIRM|nr:flagellar motor protein MotB [Petrocella atlantisensis]MCF8018474.1 flagellar motor protein MotB [Vallitaleaceae bacterium]VDN46314.1 Chemotaxis protein [Petrocella atlantisensis]